MTIYTSHSDLVSAIVSAMDGLSADTIKAHIADKRTTLAYLMRCMRRYDSAKAYCERYTDLIGVGAISFAQGRLVEFQRRANLRGSSEAYKRGARDAWAGKPENYGAHIGMRSTYARSVAEYREGYREAGRDIITNRDWADNAPLPHYSATRRG